MKYCPITYDVLKDDECYSSHGLKLLSPKLKNIKPLEFSAEELRKEAVARAGKMSIQGVQQKLSAQLKVKQEKFEIVDQNGHFILKPQSHDYPELPENEAISMSLAKIIDLEVPLHGLLYSKDDSMTYFIKRFDRYGHNKKLALEDFAQLSGSDRSTKYDSSMERVIDVVKQFCTFPKIEFVKLFKLTLFNFLIGNEDMHLKNFSLITRDKIVTLSPAYDLLNTTIAQKNTKEECALPLNGKKNNLRKKDFFNYLAIDRLELNELIIAEVSQQLQNAIPEWHRMVERSFLSQSMQTRYIELINQRAKRLWT